MNTRGLLIVIEGIDGCGKSTLAQSLHDQLIQQKQSVLLTKEPGATPLGKQLRSMVQQHSVPICPKAEYLLFAADRAQHAHQVIAPALQDSTIIISDRMGDSSLAYQGYARGLDIQMIKSVNRWALNGISPHVTIFIKIDPAIAYQRYCTRTKELSAFEQEGLQFMHKLNKAFCNIYKNRNDVIIIEGDQNQQCIVNQSIQALTPWLATLKKEHAAKNHTSSSTVARHT